MRRIFARAQHPRTGQDQTFVSTPRGADRAGRARSSWVAAGVSALALALGSFALAAPFASAGTLQPSYSVSLSANNTTVPLAANATVTARVSIEGTPSSPYYVEIFDLTTEKRVALCEDATTCTSTVSHSTAGTYQYEAYVTDDPTGYPASGILATSLPTYATWSNAGFRVYLHTPSDPLETGTSATVTATTNENVGPTPYWISIWNLDGSELAQCSTGTSCSATFTPLLPGANLVAFVSDQPTGSFLPSGIVASTNTHTVVVVSNPQ